MIRKKRILSLWILILMALSLGGCLHTQKKQSPVVDTGFSSQSEQQKTISPSLSQNRPGAEPRIPAGEGQIEDNAITNDQIEARLFSPQITRIQRPVKGLNAHRIKGESKKGDVVFNFDGASLEEVIRTFAEILKIDYILEADASGAVTIHTAGGLSKEDIFPVFSQILEASGLAAIKDGGIYRIVKTDAAPKSHLNMYTGTDVSDISPGERPIIQIISLEHMNVTEMVKIIEPFLSEKGTLIVHDDSNTMVLVDKGIVALKALDLVRVFDIDTFRQKNHHLYPVMNMDVEEAEKLLTDVLKAYGKMEPRTVLIPVKRLNTIIAVSSDTGIFQWIEDMLKQIDTPGYDSTPKIYVYKVQNGNCEDFGTLLTKIFQAPDTETQTPADAEPAKEDKAQETPVPDFGSITTTGLPEKTEKPAAKEAPEKIQRTTGSAESGADTLKGPIRISPDKDRNALIIEAYPSDYQMVKHILNQLDIMPRQVLIEVMIADITLTDSTDLGIEWTKFLDGGSVGAKNFSGSIGESGMSFTVGLSDDWQAALSMLASQGRVNVLSTPVVLASDNKEASINVADDIPVVTTEYRSVANDDDVVESTVQYRKTGIILRVIPHINDQGFVTMEVTQEVSNVGDGVTAGGKEYPSFKTRNIDTTFTVSHQQTIMIGGLMSQEGNEEEKGVPVLSALPGIGWIFGSQKESMVKKELTVFITPHVIYSMDDVAQITSEFRHRIHTTGVPAIGQAD